MSMEADHANLKWDISKEDLQLKVAQAVRGLSEKMEKGKGGECILPKYSLTEAVSLTVRKAEFTEGFLLNLWCGEEEAGQVELRPAEEHCWCIPDRMSNRGYKGKGIFKALMNAAESLVAGMADRSGKSQHISANIGQPNVFSAFEHRGYEAIPGEQLRADVLRKPELHTDEVEVRHAFVLAKDALIGGGMAEWTDGDPYCFLRKALQNKMYPTKEDAVRVTLKKTFMPSNTSIDETVKGAETRARSLLGGGN